MAFLSHNLPIPLPPCLAKWQTPPFLTQASQTPSTATPIMATTAWASRRSLRSTRTITALASTRAASIQIPSATIMARHQTPSTRLWRPISKRTSTLPISTQSSLLPTSSTSSSTIINSSSNPTAPLSYPPPSATNPTAAPSPNHPETPSCTKALCSPQAPP